MNNPLKLIPIDFNPFKDGHLDKVFPTIISQQEIWLACKIGGEQANKSYNESVSLVLEGPLKPEAIRAAMTQIVDRHEALRSSFSADGKMVLIHTEINLPFQQEDLRAMSEKEQEKHLSDFLLANSLIAFNLEKGPLFRIHLHELADDKNRLTLTIHHIIGDGWSIGVLLEDLGRIYNNIVQKKTSVKAPADQLSEYAKQLEEHKSSPAQQEIQSFWKNLYADFSEEMVLPTDFVRPEERSFKCKRMDFKVPKAKLDAIKKLGQKSKSSLVNTLLTTFEIFLSNYCDSKEIILGVPAAGQAATGNFDLVGHCVNLLPLKSKIQEDLGFDEYLAIRNQQILDCYDHQLFTYSELIQTIGLKRDLSKTTLVPVIFNLDMGMDAKLNFDGIEYQLISNPRAYDNFELTLNLTNSKDDFQFIWRYQTDLFKPETIEGMMASYMKLLDLLIAEPSKTLGSLEIIDRKPLLDQYEKFNQTFTDFPVNTPITQLFEEVAHLYPDQIALQFKTQKLSYSALNRRVNQVANLLLSKGLKDQSRIGVFLPRSADMVIALLAIAKSGNTYIPLDGQLPAERVNHILKDSQAAAVITSRSLKEGLEGNLQLLEVSKLQEEATKKEASTPNVKVDTDAAAYILYTSGSTGLPKGVLVSHRNLCNTLYYMRRKLRIDSDDKVLSITSISFDVAQIELFCLLIGGGTVIMADHDMAKDGRLLLKALKDHQITRLFSTPATYQMLIQVGWNSPLPLKIMSGGEPFSKPLAKQLLGLCKEVWNAYGPTETTILSTAKLFETEEDYDSIGQPIGNTEIYLLDPQKRLLPISKQGEIYIAGEGVTIGYLNNPAQTQEAFVESPSLPGKRLYKTGDMGAFKPNGELRCLGRIDHQVKIRGNRVELGEIELLLNTLPGISNGHVGVLDQSNGSKSLVAYIIPNEVLMLTDNETSDSLPQTVKISPEQISSWKTALSRKLPEYMLPTDWVGMEYFPLNTNGKIDKKALPKPSKKVNISSSQSKDEWTETQKMVAKIWQEGLKINNIQLDDDFFSLGGHSILAVAVMSKLDKALGQTLPLTSLFKSPILRDFCALIDGEDVTEELSQEWSSLIPIKPQGKKNPIYLIHGVAANITNYYKLIDYVDAEQPLYGLQAKGLNGIDSPNIGIENIAKHYVNEIIQHNPEGPYQIGGYSFGGYVAFEMAKQFIQRGKTVQNLIIFDTNVDQDDELVPKKGMMDVIAAQIEQRKVELQLLWKAPKTFRITKARMIKRKMENLLQKIGLKKVEEQPKDRAEIIKKIKAINTASLENYRLSPLSIDCILFKASIKLTPIKEEKYYGWAPFVNHVKVIDVEGDHNSMFESPYVEPFTHKLQALMNGEL
ncbi:hypothetical protein GCM10007049_20010 [Echinicola pacifica]|uniref:Carrier domain-containing protein n=1 Tax=Echinicola pacifica TaxID=346377 RepID=A0A918PZH8_9BACT|nr:non-ribosomal peptide synthetase [Echinicola pacifica]GGZ27237.1 hypothetical protein GCM10007049_20010 [Echinicola pacifica]